MSRTIRTDLPRNKWMRTPRYRWRLKDGQSRKHVTTDWDDKPIAALKELIMRYS